MIFTQHNFSEEGAVELYKTFLRRTHKKMPHFSTEYLNSFCSGLETGCFFALEDSVGDSFVVMPGYLRSISLGAVDTMYRDFISPYGYYGPFTSKNAGEAEVKLFWSELDNWYKQNDIISEFIRFGLEENYLFYTGELVPTLSNIKGQIIDEEQQWTNYEHKVRKNVKKAQREGLTCKVCYRDVPGDVIDSFYGIYIHTMERTNAAAHFFYPQDQFTKFIRNNPELSAIATVYDGEKPVAAELLLVSDNCTYSFLGGTLSEYFDKRPNDLLKYEVTNWARKEGIRYFVLGGGYGADDGIYKYKKSFFPEDSVTYYTGRKIINEAAYKELVDICNTTRRANNLGKLSLNDKSFFPLYRKLN